MAIDTPARIAIIGAGPIGLEAAIYARYLGYEVAVFERGRVADSVLRWGHVRMFSPFSLNRSNLGLAALAAQDPSYAAPEADELLSGQQWYRRYLLPLAESDLLAGAIFQQTEVVSIGRETLLKSELPGSKKRGEERFRILVRDEAGERFEQADVVIDASGTFAQPNWLGQGGIPAMGELSCRTRIEYGLSDILGGQRERFSGRATLVVGSGYSAATSVIALSKLAGEVPATQVTWITSRALTNGAGPVKVIENDRLTERHKLAVEANRLALSDDSPVRHFPETSVTAISFDDSSNRFQVEFSGTIAEPATFDNVIANVGGHPDTGIFRELQVHQCYATEGPMKLAAALLGESSADCLDQQSHGPQTLMNPEPNFYILGAKSYGRNSNFLFSLGLEQIREIFTVIAGREDLDLYSSVTNLLT